ncbi:MAG: radical SAM family heme chaperone HemW [Eubacteriales bacterium]|nr:radical SAM family heme chaperone HemW [Eubacteriales bacterium]MDD3573331.1 radical SAM family heme chaperone HemW [Eubacteriales bacterium]MDD4134710.1 radical SAM family heme chaperone HemW [Eubacteriales bacterium]
MSRSLGLYVHIPFCLRKCAYCDFPSYPGQEHLREAYTQALCREILTRGEALGHPEADTLFIGGGTPSLMAPGEIAQILRALREAFPWREGYEASCEANPESLTSGFLEALVRGGVNRLSLGAQASQPRLLEVIGRRHSWEQVEKGAQMAREAGISNINLDLMAGLPGQSLDDLGESLDAALALMPPHLSCYGLILEEGTPLSRAVARGTLLLPGEDTEIRMDALIRDKLAGAGYGHYEVSNHALPGQECRHNLNCWEYADYLGFGAAAAGFYQGTRRKNPLGIREYLAGEAPAEQGVGPEESRFEQVMLGLRLTKGLDSAAFERRQGLGLMAAFGQAIKRHLAGGLLAWEEGRLRLTEEGRGLMNLVLVDFLA